VRRLIAGLTVFICDAFVVALTSAGTIPASSIRLDVDARANGSVGFCSRVTGER
jgi:hypothetical protein